jgi:hypothetical protein
MSKIFQALKEAMGDDFMTPAQEAGVTKRASEIKATNNKFSQDDAIVEALKEAYGTGIMSVNLTNQFKARAKGLDTNPESGALASGSAVRKQSSNKQDLGLTHNSGPLAGTDATKPEKATSITEGEGAVMARQKADFESGRTKGAGDGNAVDNGNTVGGQNPSTFGQINSPGAGNM